MRVGYECCKTYQCQFICFSHSALKWFTSLKCLLWCPPATKRNMIIPNVCAILFLLAVFSQASHSTETTEEKHPSRMKRQSYTNNDVGNAFIDSVFNIPISTLNAVGQLIKNSRPVVQEVRRRAEQQYSQYQENQRRTSTTVQYIDLRRTTPRPRRRTAAELAAIRPAYDGSAYRI